MGVSHTFIVTLEHADTTPAEMRLDVRVTRMSLSHLSPPFMEREAKTFFEPHGSAVGMTWGLNGQHLQPSSFSSCSVSGGKVDVWHLTDVGVQTSIPDISCLLWSCNNSRQAQNYLAEVRQTQTTGSVQGLSNLI